MAMNITRSPGLLLLGIYLVLVGLSGALGLGVPILVTTVVALCAGILILIGR